MCALVDVHETEPKLLLATFVSVTSMVLMEMLATAVATEQEGPTVCLTYIWESTTQDAAGPEYVNWFLSMELI